MTNRLERRRSIFKLPRIMAGGGGASPFLSGYTSRKNIILNNSGNPEPLSNKTIEINLTSSNFNFTQIMSNGEDLRFTQNDGTTLLSFWIKSISIASQTAIIYVKLPTIAAFSSGNIFMYYNKPGSISASNWSDTIIRPQLSTSGGTTQYLVRCDEGNGNMLVNTGSLGGSVLISGTTPAWQATNAYGQTGTTPRFNGTNNFIAIPTLLDTWPVRGEISLTFRANSLPPESENRVLWEKSNRLGSTFPDLGSKISLVLFTTGGNTYVRIDTFKSNETTTPAFNNYTRFVQNDNYATIITAGSTHNLTVVWNEGCIGFYVDGRLGGRHIFYKENGEGSDFTIGAARGSIDGIIVNYSPIDIQDFRYTDYTSGQEPRLPQIESEHSLISFIQKDIRTKFAVNRWLIASNIKGRNGILLNPANATNPAYYTPLMEPVLMYDTDDLKFKIWFNDLFDPAGVKLFYREATTLAGLATATQVQCTKSGTRSWQRPNIVKLSGIYYNFYSDRANQGAAPTGKTKIYVQTGTDGKNYTNEQIALDVPISGFGSHGGFENSSNSLISSWNMLVEGLYDNGIGGYTNQIGRATDDQLVGPYTIGATPISELQWNDGSNRPNSGGPSVLKKSGTDYIFYHARLFDTQAGITTFDEMVMASTSDYISFSKYTGGYNSGVIGRCFDEIYALDQFADVGITTNDLKVQLAYSGNVNGSSENFMGSVFVAEFDGTFAQLIQDLIITIQ